MQITAITVHATFIFVSIVVNCIVYINI
jgi:hypothetical protein